MLLNWTKNVLQNHEITPRKRLGQNFLISESARTKLIDAAGIQKDDTVVEVGAGIGTITTELAKRAKRIIAVEKDRALVPILGEVTQGFDNIEVVRGDILKLTADSLRLMAVSGQPLAVSYKLVGNIPYYLTAPLIRKFLESKNPPESMALMVQREMARRICASPPDMSILAVSVQVYASPEIISFVPRSSFWPQPEVDSAILKVSSIKYQVLRIPGRKRFFTIVRAGFSNPRKQLMNNVSKGLKMSREETAQWLRPCAIDPKRRAETLSVKEWLCLTELSP